MRRGCHRHSGLCTSSHLGSRSAQCELGTLPSAVCSLGSMVLRTRSFTYSSHCFPVHLLKGLPCFESLGHVRYVLFAVMHRVLAQSLSLSFRHLYRPCENMI